MGHIVPPAAPTGNRDPRGVSDASQGECPGPAALRRNQPPIRSPREMFPRRAVSTTGRSASTPAEVRKGAPVHSKSWALPPGIELSFSLAWAATLCSHRISNLVGTVCATELKSRLPPVAL